MNSQKVWGDEGQEDAAVGLDEPRTRLHRVTFRGMMYLLCLLGMLGTAISGAVTAALTALESNFDLSTKELGLIVIAYDIGAICVATPCGYLGLNNAPKWVGGGMVLAAASLVAFALSSSLPLLVITQVVAGSGASIIWILGCTHIDNNVKNKAVSTDYTGWIMSLAPVGIVMGLMVTGAFLTGCSEESEGMNECDVGEAPTEPIAGCNGWRVPFLLLGAAMILPSIWFFFSRKHYPSPETAKCCGATSYLEEDKWSRPEPHVLSKEDFWSGLTCLFANRRFLLLIVGSALHTFQGTAVIAFGPRFMEKQLCIKRSTASLLTGTLVPCVCTGVFLGGYIPKKRNWDVGSTRKAILFMSLTTFASAPLAMVAFMMDSIGAFLALVMVSLAFMFVMSAPVVTSSQRVVPVKYRGLAVGIQSLFARAFGAVPGPLVLGTLLDSDSVPPRSAYIFLAGAGTITAGLLWLVAYFLQIKHDEEEMMERTSISGVSQDQELSPQYNGYRTPDPATPDEQPQYPSSGYI